MFTVTTSGIVRIEIQPLRALYKTHTIVSMNGFVDVRPNVPFKMLMSNYGNKRYIIPKNQTVVHLLPHPSGLIPQTVNLAQVLGLRDHRYCDRDQQEYQGVFTNVNQGDSKGPQYMIVSTPEGTFYHTTESKNDPLSKQDMEHLTDDYRSRLLTVLMKYPILHNGTLGEVVTA